MDKKKIAPAPTAALNKEITQSLSRLKIPTSIKITSINDYRNYEVVLSEITQIEKVAKAKEDSIIKPIQLGIDNLKAELKPGKERLAEAKRSIKSAMDEYRAEENRKAEQERQRILRDKRLNTETAVKKVETISPPSFSNTRRVLTLVVTDPAKIPSEFFELNEVRLKAWLKDGNTCEGARVEYKEITVSA